jgi:hypothetical protein
MAVFVLDAATVLVGVAWTGTAPGGVAAPSGTITSSTDVSGLLTQVGLEVALDEHDATVFTSGGWRRAVPGLAKGTVALGALQDFAASQLDALFGLGGTFGLSVGAAAPTTLYMDIKPTAAARSATNPSYVLKWWNLGYRLVGGSVGELAVSSGMNFPVDGRVGRLTS